MHLSFTLTLSRTWPRWKATHSSTIDNFSEGRCIPKAWEWSDQAHAFIPLRYVETRIEIGLGGNTTSCTSGIPFEESPASFIWSRRAAGDRISQKWEVCSYYTHSSTRVFPACFAGWLRGSIRLHQPRLNRQVAKNYVRASLWKSNGSGLCIVEIGEINESIFRGSTEMGFGPRTEISSCSAAIHDFYLYHMQCQINSTPPSLRRPPRRNYAWTNYAKFI